MAPPNWSSLSTPLPASPSLWRRVWGWLGLRRSAPVPPGPEGLPLHLRLAEAAGNPMLVTDLQRCIVWANGAFTRLTGYELHEVIGQSPGRLLQTEQTTAAVRTRLREALDAGQGLRIELLNRSKDGRDYWIDADIQPLRDAEGRLAGFVAVQTVITEQVQQRLRTTAMLAALPAGLVVHGRDGQVLDANPTARAMLGLDMASPPLSLPPLGAVREDLTALGADDWPAQCTARSGTALRGQIIGVPGGAGGGRRWLLVNTQPLFDALGGPDGAVACYVDMSERRQRLDCLRETARSDPLLRLAGRAEVLDRLQRAMAHRQRHPGYGFALLFIDVDHLVQVNDALGPAAGDALLRQLASRLLDTLRPGDVVARVAGQLDAAGRQPGDEFAVVLDGVHHPEGLAAVSERLLLDLGGCYRLGVQTVDVRVSIGVVSDDWEGADPAQMLGDAEAALLEAKRLGRGCQVLFEPPMRPRVAARLALEAALRQALLRDELELLYQPIVELATGRLLGVEALVRWRHPSQGLLPASAFIGVAEECGLSDAIGDFVLQSACSQFARWRRQLGDAAPALLALNLSAAQLKVPGLAPEIAAALEEHGLRPAQLQVEFVDGPATQDRQVQVTLQALKKLGLRLALDDFGSGQSTLARLDGLPVDAVKIDPGFVVGATTLEHHRVLIESTVRVARGLGLMTVAEGIETAEQAALMEHIGCGAGQGAFYGLAMPADALAGWAAPPLNLVAG